MIPKQKISDYQIQKIKDASNIVDIMKDIGYELKKDGQNLTCLCPFHTDKHLGSFKVSEIKNIYTCYSCGAHGGPVDFLMNHERLSFMEAIKWLGAKYNIDVEGSEQYKTKVTQCKPHTPAPPMPTLELPFEYVTAKQNLVATNTLVKWILSLPWDDQQKKRIIPALNSYFVGHSEKKGHTIFWQIDENLKVRTGKMMLYKEDGHRDKESEHNFDYIHSTLFRARVYDPMEIEAVTCYFGQHLLDIYPEATVNLVESEKTALICSIAYGKFSKNIWIATGGLNFFNAQKLKAFIEKNRYIVVYPDRDGVQAWKEKVKQIGYNKMFVNTDIITRYWSPEDGQKADIADVLIRMLKPQAKDIDKLKKQFPIIEELEKHFELEV